MDLSSVVSCVVDVGDPQVVQRRPALARPLFAARRAAEVAEPPDGGVVVVRAGVGDRLARVVVGQEARCLRVGPERELQELDPRETEARPEGLDLGRDQPQILGDERQLAERLADRLRDLSETYGRRRPEA